MADPFRCMWCRCRMAVKWGKCEECKSQAKKPPHLHAHAHHHPDLTAEQRDALVAIYQARASVREPLFTQTPGELLAAAGIADHVPAAHVVEEGGDG